MNALRTTPCRTCTAPIAFAVGHKGSFVPCEPPSLEEHVCDERGRVVFEPRLGHRRHECPPRAPAQTSAAAPRPAEIAPDGRLDAANWLDGLPGCGAREDLRRALEHARDAIAAALRALNEEAHHAH